MIKTISTHHGSIVHREHNVRNPNVTQKETHIDVTLSKYNEILLDLPLRDTYERLFDQEVKLYNEKQKRSERQIKSYYELIKKDKKKHLAYEMIIQIGNRYNTGVKPEETVTERAIIKEFIADWQKRNPNLELFGAYIHADETDGTLHAHIDYVPVAHNYKNGMRVQTALAKALGEQGFGIDRGNKSDTPQTRWERRENEELERLCNLRGIEVDHPQRDSKLKRKHEDTKTYKKQQELRELGEQIDIQYALCEKLKENISELQSEEEKLKSEIKKLNGEVKTADEIVKLQGYKRILGNTIVPTEQFQGIRTTALYVNLVEKECDKKLANAKSEYKQLITEKEAEMNKAITEANAEKDKFTNENSEIENKKVELHSRIKVFNDRLIKHKAYVAEKEEQLKIKENAIAVREQKVKEGMHDNSNKRLIGLEKFCSGIKYNDGKTVLEKYEESLVKEREISHNRERGR